MQPDLHQIPLDEIDAEALPRDRAALEPEALDDLIRSLATSGLRQPIEVWRLITPRPPFVYGLISGYRRLHATRALGLTQIAAFLRSPKTLSQAMAEMVAENEVRAQVSPLEKGRLLLTTVEEGHYPSLDAAIEALFPPAPRQAGHRLRGYARVAEELGDLLTAPQALSSRQADRLAFALRSGWGPMLRAALEPLGGAGHDSQWLALQPLLSESTTTGQPPSPGTGRPRRLLTLKQGLTIRREKTRTGYCLQFSGPEARKGGLIDDIFDHIERWFQPE